MLRQQRSVHRKITEKVAHSNGPATFGPGLITGRGDTASNVVTERARSFTGLPAKRSTQNANCTVWPPANFLVRSVSGKVHEAIWIRISPSARMPRTGR